MADSSSDYDRPSGAAACETYSSEKVPAAVIEVINPKRWQKEVTARRNEYARAELPEYVVVHRKIMRYERERCVPVGSLEPFHGQAVNEMVATERENIGTRGMWQGTRRKILDVIYYR